MATLTHVSRQWSSRPAPERFYDVKDIVPLLEREQRLQRSIVANMDEIRIRSHSDEFVLDVPNIPIPVRLNHWSFQRLCDQTDVDASFARKLNQADLFAPIIQHQLTHCAGVAKNASKDASDDVDDEAAALYGDVARPVADSQSRQLNILMAPDKDGGLVARDIASGTYGRYSNLALAKDSMLAVERGWRTPRAMSVGNNPYTGDHIQADRIATVDDEMRCSLIKAGMRIGPAGVYMGDRNIFIFLASDKEILPGHFRFVTLENSEVGESRKLAATFGLMNYVCMNHILWGVTNVHKVEKKHRRGAVALFTEEFAESLDLVSRANDAPEALYQVARNKILGQTRDAVSDEVFAFGKKKQLLALTRRVIDAGIQCAEHNPSDLDGASPFSLWGTVQGITRYSQSVAQADKRHAIDKAAGMLLDTIEVSDGPVSASISATVLDGGIVVTGVTPSDESTPSRKGRKSKAN